MKRIFAAINIDTDREMFGVLGKIRSSLSSERIRWIPHGNLHVTLKFFGDTEEGRIEELRIILREIASVTSPFDINLQNVGFFGKKYLPKVLWIGTEVCPQLSSLVDQIDSAIKDLGYERDEKGYLSHLTIARFKNISDYGNFMHQISLLKEISYSQHVENIILYESILSRSGAIYTEIEKFDFLEKPLS